MLTCFDAVSAGCPARYPDGQYCPAQTFTCNNTVCVHEMWVCDGDNDCGDGSDEATKLCCKCLFMTSVVNRPFMSSISPRYQNEA